MLILLTKKYKNEIIKIGDSMVENYYQMFDLNRELINQQLKKVYRELMKKYHPDNYGGSVEMAKKVNEMYEIMRDPNKKEIYDLKLDILEEEKKFEEEISNSHLNLIFDKYYRDFHNIIHNYYNYNSISVLQNKLEKCKNLNEQIKNNKYQTEQAFNYENTNTSEKNMSTVENEVVMYNDEYIKEDTNSNTLPTNEQIFIEKKEDINPNSSKINPILWYEQYKEEIKNDKNLSEYQIVELVNYIEQLKQEFIRLYASYASVNYNEETINQAINNTVKFVENMKNQMLNETMLESNSKTM